MIYQEIDVWLISLDDSFYYTDLKPDPNDFTEGETITKEKMEKSVYEALKEFEGF